MSKNSPNLGIGIGLRPFHYPYILKEKPKIDWFEIISEHFLQLKGQNFDFLQQILPHYPIVQHGVSLHIGSSDPLDFNYLKKLKALAKITKTPWISDHLSWGKLKGAHYHNLLPLPYTKEVADYVAEKARVVQDFLELPFALENITSYVSTPHDQMPEWEFYGSVIEKAGVHMMLDINNLYISSRNMNFDPIEYCNNIPLNRVIQIHLAGHRDLGHTVIDSHDTRVADPVWELYGKLYPLIGTVSTLLEWDDKFMSFEETWKEALKAKNYQYELAACNRP